MLNWTFPPPVVGWPLLPASSLLLPRGVLSVAAVRAPLFFFFFGSGRCSASVPGVPQEGWAKGLPLEVLAPVAGVPTLPVLLATFAPPLREKLLENLEWAPPRVTGSQEPTSATGRRTGPCSARRPWLAFVVVGGVAACRFGRLSFGRWSRPLGLDALTSGLRPVVSRLGSLASGLRPARSRAPPLLAVVVSLSLSLRPLRCGAWVLLQGSLLLLLIWPPRTLGTPQDPLVVVAQAESGVSLPCLLGWC